MYNIGQSTLFPYLVIYVVVVVCFRCPFGLADVRMLCGTLFLPIGKLMVKFLLSLSISLTERVTWPCSEENSALLISETELPF